MVNDELEKEKRKNMEHTKKNLMTVLKVIKLKNALGKNLNNKKYFMDKLKGIKKKDKKILLRPENASNYVYIPKNKEKKEISTNTDKIDEGNQKIKKNNFYIENNIKFEILERPSDNKQLNDYDTQIANNINKIKPILNDNFSIINSQPKNNINTENLNFTFLPADEEEENVYDNLNKNDIKNDILDNKNRKQSIKIVKIKKKKKVKRDENKQFNNIKNIRSDSFYINSSKNADNENIKCPTLILSPSSKINKKEPKHVKRNQYEIIPISNKLDSKTNLKKLNINNINNINNIREEEEEEKDDCDKIFRIETLTKLLKVYINKKIETLKIIYFMKWKYISKIKNKEDKNEKKLQKIIMKYPTIFAMKLLNFFDEYCEVLAPIVVTKNALNKKTLKILKKSKKIKKINNNKDQSNYKKKIAFEKINSVLKKHAGKYVFNLYEEIKNNK